MRSAAVEDYLRDPVDRYVAGRSFAVWVDTPSLAGSAYFGRLDERDLPAIVRLTALPEHWAAPTGFDVVVDCSRLEAMDPATFSVLLRHVYDVVPVATKLRRAALVRPAGLAGAIIAGVFHENVRPTFQSAMFADRAEGFAWLGRSDGKDALARVDALLDELAGEPPPLRELRAHLYREPARASLATAARALGMSERSLSRRLGELGTGFRDEVQRARLRAAEALLIDTDLKLDAVAGKVGFASRGHFSDFFHKATGETPSDFRARRR